MKAKVIKTGEIVNVVPVSGGWCAEFDDHVQHYNDNELDFDFQDWSAFRREAAKDILCAVLSTPGMWTETTYDGLAAACIRQVDELIKQLRK